MVMRQPPVEMLVARAGTRYAAAVIAAQRARQLSEGALPVVGTEATNPLTVALEELAAGKLRAEAPRQEAPPGRRVPADVWIHTR
jgi:DNA-directed RNA polymerase subunit omega